MALRRYELTDFEWSVIAPLLPNKPRGVARVDDRRLRTGSPWAEIPERYGPHTTCYNRFVRWGRIGVWEAIFNAVSAACDGSEPSADSTSICVHPQGANAKRGGAEGAGPAGLVDVRARALGRSRGGLTTKLHAVTDARGRPVALRLTAGQASDARSAAGLLDSLGQRLIADAAYDTNALSRSRRGARCRGPDQADAPPKSDAPPRPRRLPPTQPDREVLFQDQTIPRHRNPLRKARRHLPQPHPHRLQPYLVADL